MSANMYNWSVDLRQFKKHKKQFAIWKLEQMVNFGLQNKEKISKVQFKKYQRFLNLDDKKREYLLWLLWPQKLF